MRFRVGSNRTVFGLGDMVTTAFFSPRKAASLVWGVGPVLQARTASAPELGSRKVGTGSGHRTGEMTGPWVMGGLFQHLWPFTDDTTLRELQPEERLGCGLCAVLDCLFHQSRREELDDSSRSANLQDIRSGPTAYEHGRWLLLQRDTSRPAAALAGPNRIYDPVAEVAP
jgi:hypothetical protein